MNKRFAYYLAVAVTLVIVAYVWFVQQGNLEVGVTPGKVAVDFTLKDLDAQEHSLSDFRGSTVFLSLWTLT